MKSNLARLSLAAVLYLTLAVVLTFPLVLRLGSGVPHDVGDPLLNTWLIWWNAQHIPLSAAWWNGPFFYPTPGTLAFSEHLLGLLPITAPVQWAGGSPLTAYNLALLLSFPLSALAMHVLCLYLTGRHDLALIGGLAYGFAPYRLGVIAHLQTLSSYYMPLTLLGLHGYLRTRKPAWLALFAASWLMQGLCNGYYLVYVSVLVGLWLAWFVRDLGTTSRVLGTLAIAAVPLLPILRGYAFWHRHFGFSRSIAQAESFSADVISFFRASDLSATWQALCVPFSQTCLFPGLTLPLVVARVVVPAFLARVETGLSGNARRIRWILAVGAVLTAAGAFFAAAFGSWHLSLAGLSLSVQTLHKPLSQALYLLAALALTSDRFVSALRRRSALAFYIAACVAMWVLALGPSPRFLAMMIWDKAPYWWLMKLPGVASLRQPSRFGMLAALCLALAAVLALERLLAQEGRRRVLVIAAVAILIVGDGWTLPLPLLAAPERMGRLEAADVASASVLELPMGLLEDAAAMYRSTQHHLPLVNGYSGYEPPYYDILRGAVAAQDVNVLAALRVERPLLVSVDAKGKGPGPLEKKLDAVPGARLLGNHGGRRLYLLPKADPPQAPLAGEPLPIQAVRANRGSGDARKLIDGDVNSWWASGQRQKPGDRIVLELPRPERLSGMILAMGDGFFNYPRHLVVETSVDEGEWRTVWEGETASQAVAASLKGQRSFSIAIPTGGVQARFIRLTQSWRDPRPWSIAEITVLGAPN